MPCKIAFITLGCKVNQYETERLQKQCEEAGYIVVPSEEQADVYVVNTCTVTNIADRKSRKMLHRCQRLNPDAVIVAMGCFADAAIETVRADKNIHIVIGNGEKDNAFTIIDDYMKTVKCITVSGDVCNNSGQSEYITKERTRVYLKIQEGCNQFCSYCKIPYVRGRLRSMDEDKICGEAKELAKAGYREIVLTGIHISSYGVDKSECKSFTELGKKPLLGLIKKLAAISGIERIRLGSLEPRIITEEFVSELCTIEEVCPHFHLSLQSGCDTTLARMNRRYNTGQYKEACDILRSFYDKPAITTDIIVGFPGETEEEFEETMKYAKSIKFAGIHVFKYSKRDGTKAAVMPEQVDESIKNVRSNKLIECAKQLTKEYMESFVGTEQMCLIEECTTIDGKKYWTGHNERYVRIAAQYTEDSDLHNCMMKIIPCGIKDNILI